MIAVARGRHVIFGTGPVGAALVHALEQSGRSVISVPVNEYGSDPYGIAIMRGDPTDIEFVLRACSGAEVIYSCLNGPSNEWKSIFPPVVDTLIEAARTTGARLVNWDLAHMYGATREPITESNPNRVVGCISPVVRSRLQHRVTHYSIVLVCKYVIITEGVVVTRTIVNTSTDCSCGYDRMSSRDAIRHRPDSLRSIIATGLALESVDLTSNERSRASQTAREAR